MSAIQLRNFKPSDPPWTPIVVEPTETVTAEFVQPEDKLQLTRADFARVMADPTTAALANDVLREYQETFRSVIRFGRALAKFRDACTQFGEWGFILGQMGIPKRTALDAIAMWKRYQEIPQPYTEALNDAGFSLEKRPVLEAVTGILTESPDITPEEVVSHVEMWQKQRIFEKKTKGTKQKGKASAEPDIVESSGALSRQIPETLTASGKDKKSSFEIEFGRAQVNSSSPISSGGRRVAFILRDIDHDDARTLFPVGKTFKLIASVQDGEFSFISLEESPA